MMEYIFIDIASSATRWFLGLFIGALVAFAVGAAISANRSFFQLSSMAMNFGRAIPILALVPLIQFHLGPGEFSKILIVAIAAFFPVTVSIVLSIREGEVERLRFFGGLGLNPFRNWRVATFPRVLAGFRRGLVISVGVAWISVVAAEFLGIYNTALLNGGLGYRLNRLYDVGDISMMWLYVLIFGVLGLLSAWLVERVVQPAQELR